MNNTEFGIPGGQTASSIRVHPFTGYLYVGTGCYGTWKIGPPASSIPGPTVVDLAWPLNNKSYIVDKIIDLDADIYNDSSSIENVSFYINDEKIGEVVDEPWNLNWTPAEKGDYEIYAVASDTAGKAFNSQTVLIKILPSELPEVSISSPLAEEEFEYNANIKIQAEATDPDGEIVSVKFYMDSILLGEVAELPYSLDWKATESGTFIITAVVSDNTGQEVRSNPVSITVQEQTYSIFYFEDFNDGLAQDWQVNSGIWTIENDRYRSSDPESSAFSLYYGQAFVNYLYSVKANPDLNQFFGLLFNFLDFENYYLLGFDAYPKLAFIRKVKNGEESTVSQGYYSGGGAGNWMNILLKNENNLATVWVDNAPIMSEIPVNDIQNGYLGLYSRNNSLWFDDVDISAKGSVIIGNRAFEDAGKPKVSIYPNPFTGEDFNIYTRYEEKDLNLIIFDLMGREIYSRNIKPGKTRIPASVLHDRGVYLVKIFNNDETYTDRIIYH